MRPKITGLAVLIAAAACTSTTLPGATPSPATAPPSRATGTTLSPHPSQTAAPAIPTAAATVPPSPSIVAATSSPSPSPSISLADLAACVALSRDGTASAPVSESIIEQGALEGELVTVTFTQGQLVVRQGRAGSSAGPFGPFVVLADRVDGRATVHAVDAVRGCLALRFTRPDFVFDPAIDPSLTWLYFHRFTEDTPRAGKGLWRAALDGRSPPRQVLAPWSEDPRFEMTWSSSIGWTSDGALVDQDCEQAFCRTRTLSADGARRVFDDPVHGPFIDGSATALRVYEGVCDTDDCAILTIDRRTGEVIATDD